MRGSAIRWVLVKGPVPTKRLQITRLAGQKCIRAMRVASSNDSLTRGGWTARRRDNVPDGEWLHCSAIL